METFIADLRYAVRKLFEYKAWTVISIATLALGFGPLLASLAFIDRVFFEKLPVENPDELVAFRMSGPNELNSLTATPARSLVMQSTFSLRLFEEMRAANQTLSAMAAFTNSYGAIADRPGEQVQIQFVTGSYHQVMSTRPLLGRLIVPDDDRSGAPPVAVISEHYWEKVLSRNTKVLGTSITILPSQGLSNPVHTPFFTIVGVTPDFNARGGTAVQNEIPDLIIPLIHNEFQYRSDVNQLANPWLMIMGRRAAKVTIEQVQASFAASFDRSVRAEWESFLATKTPAERLALANRRHVPGLGFRSGSRGVISNQDYSDLGPPVKSLYAILVFIFAIPLIVATTNIATFLLSRAEDRRVEIAVRLSIGAGRMRLFRQLLSESVVLGLFGSIAGLIVTRWWLTIFENFPIPRLGHLTLNDRTMYAALILAVPVGIACGMLPATTAWRNASNMMRSGGFQFSRARSERPRNLIGIQVAVSLVMLVICGAVARTVHNFRTVDVGFNVDNVVAFSINPSTRTGGTLISYDQIAEALRKVPDVVSVSYSTTPTFTQAPTASSATVFVSVSERPVEASVGWTAVHRDFFRTLQIPLKTGSLFDNVARQTSAPVVVNEAFVRRFFPNSNPIGHHLGTDKSNVQAYEIGGVVADTKSVNAREDARPWVYQAASSSVTDSKMYFQVRTAKDPTPLKPALQGTLAAIDNRLLATRIMTPRQQIEEIHLQNADTLSFVVNYFATLSVVLAMTGLFGLLSHTVSQRTKEIGIRMAVGANPGDLLRSIMWQGVRMVLPGVIIGLGGGLFLTRLMNEFWYNMSPYDPLTISAAISLMLAVAIIAGFFPARRASQVDPVIALRSE